MDVAGTRGVLDNHFCEWLVDAKNGDDRLDRVAFGQSVTDRSHAVAIIEHQRDFFYVGAYGQIDKIASRFLKDKFGLSCQTDAGCFADFGEANGIVYLKLRSVGFARKNVVAAKVSGGSGRSGRTGTAGIAFGTGTTHGTGAAGIALGTGTASETGAAGITFGSGTAHRTGTARVTFGARAAFGTGATGIALGSGTAHRTGTAWVTLGTRAAFGTGASGRSRRSGRSGRSGRARRSGATRRFVRISAATAPFLVAVAVIITVK